MRNVESIVLEFILRKNLIEKNDKILLALSGGADSVFAFHFLLKYRDRLGIEFGVFHLNHQLRGTESDGDAVFCEELCVNKNIPFHSENLDIKKLSADSVKSIEEFAREIRYKLLLKISSDSGYTKIITAHNKDDNTETVLLNLFKGCGVSALGGIPLKRENIIRPLLCLSKKEITRFLEDNRIQYRVDSSNTDLQFERNYIRHELIPKIEEFINPSVNDTVFRTSVNVNEFYSMFTFMIEENYRKHISKVFHKNENSFQIHLNLFSEGNEFIVGEALKKLFVNELRIEYNSKMHETILSLSNNNKGKEVHLKDYWHAVKERDSILIYKWKEENSLEIRFSVGSSVSFEPGTLETSILESTEFQLTGDKNSEFISADNLDDIFILRKWKFGDKFIPLGMKGEKLISDFLTDVQIPSSARNDIYVLVNRNNIVWVVGLRIHDHYKITNSTKRICKICLK